MRILVVEDDRRMAELLRQGLSEEGHSVTIAVDGRAGLSLAESDPFELLILDVMLPGIDGFSIARRLRSPRHNQGYRGGVESRSGRLSDEAFLVRRAVRTGSFSRAPRPDPAAGEYSSRRFDAKSGDAGGEARRARHYPDSHRVRHPRIPDAPRRARAVTRLSHRECLGR